MVTVPIARAATIAAGQQMTAEMAAASNPTVMAANAQAATTAAGLTALAKTAIANGLDLSLVKHFVSTTRRSETICLAEVN
jgi:hypothetical protein